MITLQDLQNYYTNVLCEKTFQYTLQNAQPLQILFFKESFCHLLGIQHVIRDKAYLGKSGYELIKSGNLTIKRLKAINKNGFSKIKHRIFYFNQIGHLLSHGETFKFYPERVKKGTKIKASFLIHEESLHLYLHLFLAKEQFKKNIYSPMSYIPLTENDANPKMYISGQEYKKILKFEILPSLHS